MLPLGAIARQTNADSAALMVPDTKKRYSYCYASYNMPPEWVAIKNSFDEKVPGGNTEVYKTGKPAITNHLRKELAGHYVESVMIVPVVRNGQTIAMLELVHSTDNKIFTGQDLQSTQDFTLQLGLQLPERL